MFIQILIDNPESWIISWADQLKNNLISDGHESVVLHDPEKVVKGDILCLLSCQKLFKKLHLNRHNLVVHESNLPKGKGWSPLTWQILEEKKEIVISLFEATEEVDAGDIYMQETIALEGHELIDELRSKQGQATIKLILMFVEQYPNVSARPQKGNDTVYRKRGPEDSELDPDKSIREQFGLLKVADPVRYPAYFRLNGQKYILNIQKKEHA